MPNACWLFSSGSWNKAAQHAHAPDWLRLATLGSPAGDTQPLGGSNRDLCENIPYCNFYWTLYTNIIQHAY